jgi:hypothetical protein
LQLSVRGEVPTGRLVVTGSTSFGGVRACCSAERTIALCNVGDCVLHVTRVMFRRKSPHWKLVNNPFPAPLHPGSCLSVVIRYKATEKCPRSCDLVIRSDDPKTPEKVIEVLAHTVWPQCRGKDDNRCEPCTREKSCERCCTECCDDCDDYGDEDAYRVEEEATTDRE